MIRVNDLDKAYEQTLDLFNTENDMGKTLLDQFFTLISGLKDHWIGEDGTNHINNLIDIHDKLQKFLSVSLASTKSAMIDVVSLQELRRANGGGGQVGLVKSVEDDGLQIIPKVETTAQYYIDPAIKEDFKLLEQLESNLKDFDDKIDIQRNDLMENWISGSNREEIQGVFEEINNLAEEAEKVVADAKNELSIAINNAQDLM